MLAILVVGMIVASIFGATEATPYKSDVIDLFFLPMDVSPILSGAVNSV